MSRFSKAEAEARGWVFVHYSEDETLVTSETQGETRYLPASYRAEKYFSLPGQGQSLINEEAETLGLLLEKIYAFEHQVEIKSNVLTPLPVEIVGPVDEAGIEQRTVHTSEGVISEEEWSSRERTDAIYDGDKMVYHGPQPVAEEADEAREKLSKDLEDAATAEEDVEERVFQEEVDAAAQAPVIADQDRREALTSERENARVVSGQGVGLGDSFLVASEELPEPEVVEEPEVEEVEEVEPVVEEEPGPQVYDSEPDDEVEEVIPHVEKDEEEVGAVEPEEPNATSAAAELAAESGVDLSEVEGSGKDGKITKPDVEAALPPEIEPPDPED